MITTYIVGIFIMYAVLCYLDIEFSPNYDYMGMLGCFTMSIMWPFTLIGILVFLATNWNKR